MVASAATWSVCTRGLLAAVLGRDAATRHVNRFHLDYAAPFMQPQMGYARNGGAEMPRTVYHFRGELPESDEHGRGLYAELTVAPGTAISVQPLTRMPNERDLWRMVLEHEFTSRTPELMTRAIEEALKRAYYCAVTQERYAGRRYTGAPASVVLMRNSQLRFTVKNAQPAGGARRWDATAFYVMATRAADSTGSYVFDVIESTWPMTAQDALTVTAPCMHIPHACAQYEVGAVPLLAVVLPTGSVFVLDRRYSVFIDYEAELRERKAQLRSLCRAEDGTSDDINVPYSPTYIPAPPSFADEPNRTQLLPNPADLEADKWRFLLSPPNTTNAAATTTTTITNSTATATAGTGTSMLETGVLPQPENLRLPPPPPPEPLLPSLRPPVLVSMLPALPARLTCDSSRQNDGTGAPGAASQTQAPPSQSLPPIDQAVLAAIDWSGLEQLGAVSNENETQTKRDPPNTDDAKSTEQHALTQTAAAAAPAAPPKAKRKPRQTASNPPAQKRTRKASE